ncbi:putative transposase [Mariprofundus micogutta]|uniref:Putative transposase n=1 Tax=Mariprofundus micogutta TaxID=1921010 RepID=A0A1L8CLJ5_9PROT|nr:RNA-guided endonuclease TnpB family protein [Mariprofundus micogutta]GAV19800.1 putative transposase [Mariprofundus micogutta]
MQIGNKFRCYPDKRQQEILHRWIGCQRFIYNAKVREDRYFRSFSRQSLSLAGMKTPVDQKYAQFISEETVWLKDTPSQLLRNGATLWKQAYQRFFNGLAKRPKLHKRIGRQSVWITSELFNFMESDGKHSVQLGSKSRVIGSIPFKAHREFNAPASIHISVDAGQWFLSFSYDDGVPEAKEEDVFAYVASLSRPDIEASTIGIDRNTTGKKVATSSGQSFDYSGLQKKRMLEHERKSRRWQRIQARRTKGSKRYGKAKAKVARYKRYAKNTRHDFAHKTSRTLVDQTGVNVFVSKRCKQQVWFDLQKALLMLPERK